MKYFKMLALFCLIFLVASCANTTPRVGSDYEAGIKYAEQYAKEDAMAFDCKWFGWRVFTGFEARKYTDTLKSQGKTQTFIEGFYLGYGRYYNNYLRVYCEE